MTINSIINLLIRFLVKTHASVRVRLGEMHCSDTFNLRLRSQSLHNIWTGVAELRVVSGPRDSNINPH